MKQQRILFAAGAFVAAASIPAQVVATPASGFTAVQQWKGVHGPLNVKADKTEKWDLKLTTKDTSDVYVVRNSVAVGGESGWHRHPGPSLITVTLGEITAYESSDPLCTPKVYQVGDAFVDHGDHAHLLRNESDSPAETVAVQFLPEGAIRRIDAPEPNNCSF